jgi:hypothetical protein
MLLKSRIIEVTADNLDSHPGAICFINPKNQYYNLKVSWLKEQFKTGLKIKMLYIEGEKNPRGFIEYVPGEFCWRPVSAKGYMFIHCIWTNGKKYQHQGLGKLLINEAEKDAAGMNGVAVMTSEGPFMANKNIFLKNGYSVAAESGKDQLLYKPFREAPIPVFMSHELLSENNEGLIMTYSRQCPWVARFIEEVNPVLERKKLKPCIIEIKTPEEAQKASMPYGVFNLIYNGKILADRYISLTRFENIINKEIR